MNKKTKWIIGIGAVCMLAIIFAFALLGGGPDDPLSGTSWTRTTDVDSEVINFNSDGHFAYYYGVGSPVDDYDLFDQYTYDSEAKTITLKSVIGGDDRIIPVDSLDETTLVLVFGTEKRTFTKTGE